MASRKISRIRKCFHRSKQKIKKYFSKEIRCQKNIDDNTESTDLIFKAFTKIIHLVTLSL
jgi:hypothetical protein